MRGTVDSLLGQWRLSFSAPLRRSLTRLWRWWITELTDLIPQRVRSLVAGRQRERFLQIDGDEVALLDGPPDQSVERGRWPLQDASGLSAAVGADDSGFVVILPPDRLLSRSIELPAGAEEDLGGVLELEMDRQTPFSAAQVYYDFAVTGRSPARKTVTVELVLTPRSRLDSLLTTFSRLGISPTGIKGIDGSGRLVDLKLLPVGRAPHRQPLVTRLNVSLAATVLILLGGAVAVPVLQKQAAIAELEPRVAAAQESAREGSRIRRNIESLTAGTVELIERKQREATTIRQLDEITSVVPDDTWVERIEIDREAIDLHGQSTSTAAMIALLESSDSFGDPQFRSPVTQISGSDRERFHISIAWTGGAND